MEDSVKYCAVCKEGSTREKWDNVAKLSDGTEVVACDSHAAELDALVAADKVANATPKAVVPKK